MCDVGCLHNEHSLPDSQCSGSSVTLQARLKIPLFHSLVAIYSFNNWMFEALQEKIEFDFYP